jgi:PTH1 family peptidyl-tRNA hydrolase
MNLSGESVAQLLAFYKEDASKIIVVYDDTDTALGMLRIREKGTAGGHNGVKSIISHLGTNEFIRIKVGVGEKPLGWDLANYVLSRFNKDELEIIVKSIERASKAIDRIISDGTYVAMNDFNGFS